MPNDIISMNKSQLKKSSLPDFLQNKYKTNKNISEFLKELEVFESGEWSLIELLEDYDIYIIMKNLYLLMNYIKF